VSNLSRIDLHIQRVFIGREDPNDNAGDFAITGTTCLTQVQGSSLLLPRTLSPYEWCTIDFAFTPAAAGLRKAEIVIGDDTRTAPQLIPVLGTGLSAEP
jgi:hypothetical protein